MFYSLLIIPYSILWVFTLSLSLCPVQVPMLTKRVDARICSVASGFAVAPESDHLSPVAFSFFFFLQLFLSLSQVPCLSPLQPSFCFSCFPIFPNSSNPSRCLLSCCTSCVCTLKIGGARAGPSLTNCSFQHLKERKNTTLLNFLKPLLNNWAVKKVYVCRLCY